MQKRLLYLKMTDGFYLSNGKGYFAEIFENSSMPSLSSLRFVFFALALSLGLRATGQTFWKATDVLPDPSARLIQPETYLTYDLDIAGFTTLVLKAPDERIPGALTSSFRITLPAPNGEWRTFRIQKTPLFHPDLVRKYPGIHTFAGVAADRDETILRMEVTHTGLHAMVLDGAETYFIEPYTPGQTTQYQVYYKRDSGSRKHDFSCETEADEHPGHGALEGLEGGDCQLRTYRLALACTGEYAQFHGGTKPLVLSAYATSMNRINGVYEREVAVRMQLISNTDTLIFLTANTDPYTNSNGGAMLGQNQTTVDNRIGSANYDIGHVFSTGGGGIASLGSVCSNFSKARGVTGSNVPVGDGFDIDYVAHEMGHQFGGRHTQNNNCNRDISSYEPGSGSTIMGYAGICSPDVQFGSDDYFHAISLQEIYNFLAEDGGSCPATTPLPNNPPVVTAGPDRVIPKGTPFDLTAVASDPDTNDVLTYCWEQFDNDVAQMPPRNTSTSGPAFRSFDPTTNPTRTFPRIQSIVGNANTTWEVLPVVSRVMNFRVTVRDNAPGGGCTDEDDLRLTVDGNSGPLAVTEPNTNVTWLGGTYVDVRWNVANTDVAPVNSPLVNIRLSTDGGFTYPILLAANVPNNGLARVIAPEIAGVSNRVRVEGAGHVFFDVSDRNFTITLASAPGVSFFALPDTVTTCAPDPGSFGVELLPLLGFSDTLDLYVTGLPAGVTHVWSQNPSPVGIASLTLLADTSVAGGFYPFVAGAILPNGDSVSRTLYLDLQKGEPGLAFPLLPFSGDSDVSRAPTLTWGSQPGVFTFDLEIATGPQFGATTFASATGLSQSSFTPSVFLDAGTVYYWRVRTTNVCGEGEWSQVFSFQTGAETCRSYPATFVPVVIPAFSATTFNSIRNVTDNFAVRSVRLENIQGNHERMSDLTIDLRSPLQTQVRLLDRACNNITNTTFFFSLADNAPAAMACPPAIAGVYRSANSLGAYFNEPSAGNWNVIFGDPVFGAGGQITNYTLVLCKDTTSPAKPVFLIGDTLEVVRAASAEVDSSHLFASQTGVAPAQITYRIIAQPVNGVFLLGADTLSLGDTFTQQDVNTGEVTYQHDGSLTGTDRVDVDVRTGAGGWAGTQTLPVKVLNRTALDDLDITRLKVYPVPADEALNVSFETSASWSVRLISLMGQTVGETHASGGTGQVRLDVSGLPAGIYLLEVMQGEARYVRKVEVK